jgi:hypothetical protein
VMPLEDVRFFLVAFAITIGVEAPVLLVGLSSRHKLAVRLFAAVWLTACTYPLLALVLPVLMNPHRFPLIYMTVGESFVVVAEITLFWLTFIAPSPWGNNGMARDIAAITSANIASFGLGLLLSGSVAGPWEIAL